MLGQTFQERFEEKREGEKEKGKGGKRDQKDTKKKALGKILLAEEDEENWNRLHWYK